MNLKERKKIEQEMSLYDDFEDIAKPNDADSSAKKEPGTFPFNFLSRIQFCPRIDSLFRRLLANSWTNNTSFKFLQNQVEAARKRQQSQQASSQFKVSQRLGARFIPENFLFIESWWS